MLFERILVPLDGSQSAEVVLPYLRRLPLKAGAQVILVRIVEPGAKDPGPGFVEESLEFAEGYLLDVAARLGITEGIIVETVVRSDRVAESLVSIADEAEASLIVMATHGRTASPERPFGGVAQQLMRSSPSPILALPSVSRAMPDSSRGGSSIRTILVTTDGSDYADSIAPLAADAAVACGASILLLEVIPTGASESRASNEQASAEEHLQHLARTFENRGIPTEFLTRKGTPVNGILQTAKRRNVDLIAMSTHGGAKRFGAIVGSVTQSVLHQAGIPVLMNRIRPAPKVQGERRKVARARPRGL
jgi:nucleotide-binding universal stress UspA family protein